jgi:hypothetical protein
MKIGQLAGLHAYQLEAEGGHAHFLSPSLQEVYLFPNAFPP